MCEGDLALQLILFAGYGPTRHLAGTIKSINRPAVDKLAAAFDLNLDWNDADRLKEQAYHLLDTYSLEGSKFVLDRVQRFAEEQNKKVIVILFDPYRSVPELIDTGKRYDQPILDHLKLRSMKYFDMTAVQFADFKRQTQPYQSYRTRYFVDSNGHYSSEGNNLFAFSLKDHLIEWLSPKPVPYRRARGRNEDNYIFNGRLGSSDDNK